MKYLFRVNDHITVNFDSFILIWLINLTVPLLNKKISFICVSFYFDATWSGMCLLVWWALVVLSIDLLRTDEALIYMCLLSIENVLLRSHMSVYCKLITALISSVFWSVYASACLMLTGRAPGHVALTMQYSILNTSMNLSVWSLPVLYMLHSATSIGRDLY